VPARGFDVRGHRLGRGAGYYDRYLSQPGCRAIKCGIAFDVQVIDDLPYDDDDVPVDIVLTESRTLRRG
jgi:5-formyltetrahydrofolate cyclo-ligase